MAIILFLFTSAFLILRIIYVNLARGKELAQTIIKLLGDAQSMKYFIPLKYLVSEEPRTRKLKVLANLFLYLFFISFLVLIIYGIFTELRQFEY